MILDISKEAVRKRVQRGTLRSEMGADGRRYVYLDEAKPGDGFHLLPESGEQDRTRHEVVDTLREQLAAEREANRENRRLLAAALERIPAIESPEPRGSPENGAGRGSGAEVPADDTEQPRARWWRRFFGFGEERK